MNKADFPGVDTSDFHLLTPVPWQVAKWLHETGVYSYVSLGRWVNGTLEIHSFVKRRQQLCLPAPKQVLGLPARLEQAA